MYWDFWMKVKPYEKKVIFFSDMLLCIGSDETGYEDAIYHTTFVKELREELESLNYKIIDHDVFVAYEHIPFLVAQCDLTICFWDKFYTSSTWKMIELEKSLQADSPTIMVRLDNHKTINFSERYEGQLIWLEADKKLVLEKVRELIG